MAYKSFMMASAGLLWAASALAQTAPAPTMYLQAGAGDHNSAALTVGATFPWGNWSWSLGSGTVRGHWDAYVGGWSGKDLSDHRFTTAVIGIGPSLRWRGAQGTSPWFFEAGTSLMVSNKYFYNGDERMGTRWNFASHLGLGRNFGSASQHELSLRVQHASNAGIKKPNPGINFLQLRYARAF